MAAILVVDDELGIRALLLDILSDEGHAVELAENAAQARAYREREPPDLVLLDIWMPDVKLKTTTDPAALAAADYIIVAVPNPIDNARLPDFSPLVGASRTVGQNMKKGAIVIYESTVYPGATEEVCIPVLEQHSGKKWKKDFHVGYSPEPINPGDKEHTLTRIVKVVSGDDAATLDAVANLYSSVIKAGVHRASSIAVA